jgi:hypothetical protein
VIWTARVSPACAGIPKPVGKLGHVELSGVPDAAEQVEMFRISGKAVKNWPGPFAFTVVCSDRLVSDESVVCLILTAIVGPLGGTDAPMAH